MSDTLTKVKNTQNEGNIEEENNGYVVVTWLVVVMVVEMLRRLLPIVH